MGHETRLARLAVDSREVMQVEQFADSGNHRALQQMRAEVYAPPISVCALTGNRVADPLHNTHLHDPEQLRVRLATLLQVGTQFRTDVMVPEHRVDAPVWMLLHCMPLVLDDAVGVSDPGRSARSRGTGTLSRRLVGERGEYAAD